MALQNTDNLTQQADEIEALCAIYGDDVEVESEIDRRYSIKLQSPSDSLQHYEILLKVKLPENYPSSAPPVYELSAPWLRGRQRLKLQSILEATYDDNIGESILFGWTEKIREFLQDNANFHQEAREKQLKFERNKHELHEESMEIEIVHNEPITDRKSTFQGHCAKVHDLKEVKWVVAELKKNKKIADATHNIMAYRIYCTNKKIFLQDYDDDGESHAGNRVLHLMQILDVKNFVVVVSRWYGGIMLGPDRFKHINNAARDVMKIMGSFEEKVSTQNKHKK